MVKYVCLICDYNTEDKSNYNKHIKSKAHNRRITDDNEAVEYSCTVCNKTFTHASSFSRHNNNNRCMQQNKDSEINILKNLVINYENITHQLLDYVRDNKTNIHNQTYNISIKNCIQQNYPDAPALEGLPDYERILYNNHDINDPNSNIADDFIDTLTYEYSNNCLNKYLGDFIITCYKKENPSEQSMWTSDTSRLTYIIKELLANNNSIWNHDYKGIKTKEYIITPLLKYIRSYIDEYWVKQLDNYKDMNLDRINKIHNTYQVLYKIKKEIENDVIGYEIVKYMAPHFYMDKERIIKHI